MLTFEDGADVPTFLPRDEGTHAPGDDRYWQESCLMLWGDLSSDCGGLLRVGHTPNLNGGEMTVWAYAFTPGWVYADDFDMPQGIDDRTTSGLSAGTAASYDFDGHNTIWRHAGKEVEFELVAHDYYPPISLWRTEEGNLAFPHSEAACRITGQLRIRDEVSAIDGMGLRDHSWGVRHWGKGKVHRWFNAVFGPDLSMCLLTMLTTDTREIRRLGYVVRDGVVHYSSEVDIIVHMEPDGATHRGGIGRIRLDNGEVLEFMAEPVAQGAYMSRHDRYLFQSLCRVRHKDRTGFGDFEITENAHAGVQPPSALVNGIISKGVHFRRTPVTQYA
ncbi:hypothetical protein NUH86_06280 [Sphingobium sp. JS3065]|uniref:DUF7064 domain-containing protein n=1 Tax=Sphingobium sp. JS3065 TaxID=2970925 RepID=UPI0022654ACF|nr:hypothetical protein [Sphingobium sp. JS3065]UZW56379.1 hypothetical protein NUH86_06280 [Sphingobium sp. JS3065]